MAPSFTTWSKSYQGQPAAVAVPADEAEVVAIVRRAVADVRAIYPNAGAFIDLARELDPASVFRNPFLDRMLGPGAG